MNITPTTKCKFVTSKPSFGYITTCIFRSLRRDVVQACVSDPWTMHYPRVMYHGTQKKNAFTDQQHFVLRPFLINSIWDVLPRLKKYLYWHLLHNVCSLIEFLSVRILWKWQKVLCFWWEAIFSTILSAENNAVLLRSYQVFAISSIQISRQKRPSSSKVKSTIW